MEADRRELLREAAALAALAIVLTWTPLLLLLATTAAPDADATSMILWGLGGSDLPRRPCWWCGGGGAVQGWPRSVGP